MRILTLTFITLSLIFVFCSKNGFRAPQPGKYITAADIVCEQVILHTQKNQITDQDFISSYLKRNSSQFYTGTMPLDTFLAHSFRVPGSYPASPSSLEMEISKDLQFDFHRQNFIGVPDTTGYILKTVGEYTIIETDRHVAFNDQSASCLRPNVLVTSNLNSCLPFMNAYICEYTARLPLRFTKDGPELMLLNYHYKYGPNCIGLSGLTANAPHPDIANYLLATDTVVTQIYRWKFIKKN